MAVRMVEQARSGMEIARWLMDRPEVARVIHPALPDHPQHALWKRDFSGAASLFALVLKPGPKQAVEAFLDRLTLFGLGYSWGGFESLASCGGRALEGRVFPPELGGPLVRLHVGLEATADLIADLEQALEGY